MNAHPFHGAGLMRINLCGCARPAYLQYDVMRARVVAGPPFAVPAALERRHERDTKDACARVGRGHGGKI